MNPDTDPLQPTDRVIKPRTKRNTKLQVVAVSNDMTLNEDGELKPWNIDELRSTPSTLFVKMASADWLTTLDEHFAPLYPNAWQWRASTNEREIVRDNGKRVASQVSTVVHYFGFKNGTYHKVIDPVVMYGRSLDEIIPGDDKRLVKLLKWGVLIRDFCDENNLEVRPTMGGIASQFLTDPRFYPKARRKVPAKTNERVREQLPGNYYGLYTIPDRHSELSAWYIDQTKAHHYHARTSELPDANSLYAYGHYHDLNRFAFAKTVPDFKGLYCLHLTSPYSNRQSHWLKSGKQFVYSNELDHLLFMGYRVNGVYAAWGSLKRDTGLPKYATWAEQQLDRHENAKWIKPLLLATYGTLATRPRQASAVFKMAKKGEKVSLVTGNRELHGTFVQSARKLEPGIANVLHRGMIEAATRSESIFLAQDLTGQGFRVLSIYADAVIVENDGTKSLPPMTEPWRVKAELNHLQFINSQAFISGEMTKLPGVSQEARKHHNSYGRG
jgi:hypothetical protein